MKFLFTSPFFHMPEHQKRAFFHEPAPRETLSVKEKKKSLYILKFYISMFYIQHKIQY